MACLHIPTPTAVLPCPPPSSVFPRSTSISANKLYLLIMSTLEKYRAEYLEHPWTQPMTHSPTAHCIAAAAGTDGYLTRLTLPCTSTTFSMIRVINCATHLFAPIFHSCSLIFIPVRLVQTCRVIQIYGPNGRNISDRRNTRQQAEIPATSSNWQGPIRWTHHK